MRFHVGANPHPTQLVDWCWRVAHDERDAPGRGGKSVLVEIADVYQFKILVLDDCFQMTGSHAARADKTDDQFLTRVGRPNSLLASR